MLACRLSSRSDSARAWLPLVFAGLDVPSVSGALTTYEDLSLP